MNRFFFALIVISLLASFGFTQESSQSKIPRFVIGPPGKTEFTAYRQLIEHPEQWAKLRPHVGALLVTANWLNKQYPDDAELKTAMDALRKIGIPLEFEVGALKEGPKTGEKTYQVQTKGWDRIINAGGDVRSFAMDEPFINSRIHQKVTQENNRDMEFAADETATFIELVRKNYPTILIGDIEGFPALSAVELIQWIDLLQAKLKAKGVRGLDFFRVDTDWMNFVANNNKGDWRALKKIELHCRQIGLPFSVIYWAANYPHAITQGTADDRTWYTGMMQMAYDYNYANGSPDQYVIESWVGAPEKTLPDSDPFSFTGGALDFVERFVIEKPKK